MGCVLVGLEYWLSMCGRWREIIRGLMSRLILSPEFLVIYFEMNKR